MKLGVLVYIEHKEQVLMLNRKKQDEHLGLWLAPGGKIERNEAPIEAAIRETQEETGLIIHNPELKGILTFTDYGDSPFGDEWTVFVFYTSNFSGTCLEECSEGTLAWIPKEELLDLPMWEGDLLFTPKVFESGFFNATLNYHGQKMESSRFWVSE